MATDFIDKLTFLSHPSGKSQGKHHIVIVGAGIIGVCTAYYLTRHPDFHPDTHHITILESKRVAGGASGKAGGLLASWAFPQQIVPLSFRLHQELSDEYDGGNVWDYRRLTTVSLEADVEDLCGAECSKRDGESCSCVSSCSSSSSSSSSCKSSSSQTSGLKVPVPKKKRNNDILSGCEAEDEDSGRSSSFFHSDSNLNSLSMGPRDRDPADQIDFNDANDFQPQSREITGDLAADDMRNNNASIDEAKGPSVPLPGDLNWIKKHLVNDWSSLGGTDSTAQVHPYKFTHFLLSKAMESNAVDLILGKVDQIQYNDSGACCGISYTPTAETEFASTATTQRSVNIDDSSHVVLAMGPWTSKILPDCPISGLRAHSITIKPSTGTVSPYAIFTELKIDKNQYFSPEMYARKDEVYVCGEGDTLVDLPETSDAVEVVREKCDELYHYVSKLSKNLSSGHILKRQACYLPVLNVPTSSGPLIGETNVDGLYVASGHSCWGINNAPATGKVMAELLLEGEAKSADISALDPGLYFDASILE
ncbi:Tda3p TDEL_0A04590 [Torulaspora delbrueckii]|uniref:FAD dependent oxidoreductase domain-containing protein n=1 Tax=Torulaspora delbrueckii TaxID=4950 RepID=G8ZME7_TORDE|nr:hypothetical protein TDEL_0A04590 [Torulaspora delbrueckii]CCE89791.1 hypothetical protein TDEL_0A04590 [Torulaspora delbrueckii]